MFINRHEPMGSAGRSVILVVSWVTSEAKARLQNSRFWKFPEGAKRRKRDPRV